MATMALTRNPIEMADGRHLHWVGGVPVDVVEAVGRRCRFGDEVDHQQEKVDDEFGRHDDVDGVDVLLFDWSKFLFIFFIFLSFYQLELIFCVTSTNAVVHDLSLGEDLHRYPSVRSKSLQQDAVIQ